MEKRSRSNIITLAVCVVFTLSTLACSPQKPPSVQPLPSPSPIPSPTPICVDGTWSYDEDVQTKIEITPDLKIEITHVGGWGFCPRTLRIHGDGRVEIKLGERDEASQTTMQITKDQLEQIVSKLEQANFFGVSYGCQETFIEALDAGLLDISVETQGKVHKIEDHGVCGGPLYNFRRYCSLGDSIEEIVSPDLCKSR